MLFFACATLAYSLDVNALTPSQAYEAGKAAVEAELCGDYNQTGYLLDSITSTSPNLVDEFYRGFLENDKENQTGGFTLEEGTMDCDEILAESSRIMTLLITNVSQNISKNPKSLSVFKTVADRTVCYMAVNIKSMEWYRNSNSSGYVKEAKSRKFSPTGCAKVLGYDPDSPSVVFASDIPAKSDNDICKYALSALGENWDYKNSYFSRHVKEAKRRGFSEQDCATILGRASKIKLVEEKRESAGTNNNTDFGSNYSDRKICEAALSISPEGTFQWGGKYNLYVMAAKARKLSVQICVGMLSPAKIGALAELRNQQRRNQKKEALAEELRKQKEAAKTALLAEIERQREKQRQKEKREKQAKQLAIKNKLAAQAAREAKIEEERKARLRAVQQKKAKEAKRRAKIEREQRKKIVRRIEKLKLRHRDAIAVIVGNKAYRGRTPPVDFAINDAEAIKKFILTKLLFRPGNIIDLRNATKAELEDAFGTKGNHKGRLHDYVRAGESDVIVFYSGHGVPGVSDKRGYLLPVDANPNRAEITGYSLDIFFENLSKVPSRSMTVFIDACFSGDSPKGMIVRSTSGLTVKIKPLSNYVNNMIVVTAAKGDQYASWDEKAERGLFTNYLLKALNGAADRNARTGNNDGKVTLGEVKKYLDREMTYQARRRFSREQTATVRGDLSAVLTSY